MAHPTRRFFGVEASGEYKLIPCYWYKSPRPVDLQGSHPFYDDPNRVTIRFWNILTEHIGLVRCNYDKVTLETWTAPDCIFEKKQLGYWASYGHCVLENVTFLKDAVGEQDEWKFIEADYHFDKCIHLNKTEEIQLSVDHIPDDDHSGWGFKLRPRVTAEDILAYRGVNLYTIKPDVIVVNNGRKTPDVQGMPTQEYGHSNSIFL